MWGDGRFLAGAGTSVAGKTGRERPAQEHRILSDTERLTYGLEKKQNATRPLAFFGYGCILIFWTDSAGEIRRMLLRRNSVGNP